MHIARQKKTIAVVATLVALASVFVWATHSSPVDFNADVKPIINKKCITCHGGVPATRNEKL